MKFRVRDLRLGELLVGKVQELLPGGEVIISFDGDLLRVHNESQRELQAGAFVSVRVTAVEPLRFQLVPERREQRRRGQLDTSA